MVLKKLIEFVDFIQGGNADIVFNHLGFYEQRVLDPQVGQKSLNDHMPFQQKFSQFFASLGEADYSVLFVVQ